MLSARLSMAEAGVVPAKTAAPATSGLTHCDFDLHGLVGVRLLGAAARDCAVVKAQLGPLARPLHREPDIVVRFVDHLPARSGQRWLGVNDAAFTDEAFLILQGKHKTPARVQLSFDTIGNGCEIVCERGLAAVPLLIPIVNLTVLAKGGLALHASAFRYQGRGVLVTGWSKGGKTETLLGFMENGAEYIGDEWIYFRASDARMLGIPEPIRVWDSHLAQLPRYWRKLGFAQQLRLRSLRQATATLRVLSGSRTMTRPGWRQRAGQVADLLDRQRYVHLRPHEAFDCVGGLQGTVDCVLFVGSHDSPAITIDPIEPSRIADRMTFSLQEERSHFLSYYRKFRFAFPDRTSPRLDAALAAEPGRLRILLQDLQCYEVYHPYPPSIPKLFAALRTVVA